MKTKFLKYGLTGFVLLLLVACGEDEPPPALTSTEREMIDTLYLRRITVLRPQLDSLCNADFAANVQRAVDSLIKVRKAEEVRLRQRILQEQSNN